MTSWAPSQEDTLDIVGAAPGTTVEIEVRSVDAVGNVSATSTSTITVDEQLEDPEMLEAGAEAYIEEFGGSMANAVQWMERQVTFRALNDGDPNAAISAAAPGAYGGVWMNNVSRRVGIQVTTSTAKNAVEDVVDDWGVASFTDVTVVSSTQGQLDATLSDFDTSLENLLNPGLISTARDTENNAVLVKVSNEVTPSQEAQIQAAAAASSVTVNIQPTGEGAFKIANTACSNTNCDGPMRGGVSIVGDDQKLCTAGFIARSLISQTRYVLTAGHCFDGGASTWSKLNFVPTYAEIGASAPGPIDDGRGDIGMIDLQPPWSVSALNGVLQNRGSKRHANYRIRRASYLQHGSMICRQGVVTGKTICARSFYLRESTRNARAFGTMRTCGKRGDSGGPIFFGHTAYGITAKKLFTGMEDTPSEKCVATVYTGARTAENHFGVKISG